MKAKAKPIINPTAKDIMPLFIKNKCKEIGAFVVIGGGITLLYLLACVIGLWAAGDATTCDTYNPQHHINPACNSADYYCMGGLVLIALLLILACLYAWLKSNWDNAEREAYRRLNGKNKESYWM